MDYPNYQDYLANGWIHLIATESKESAEFYRKLCSPQSRPQIIKTSQNNFAIIQLHKAGKQ